jgi:anti-anti-sigma factor
MPDAPKPNLTSHMTSGVLVVRIDEPQFHGDPLAEAIREEIMTLLADSGSQKIVLDLQPVRYLSSAAFRPLLSLRRKLQETGGHMVLCNMSPLITELFQLLRLISINPANPAPFDVRPNVAAAVEFLNTHGSGG